MAALVLTVAAMYAPAGAVRHPISELAATASKCGIPDLTNKVVLNRPRAYRLNEYRENGRIVPARDQWTRKKIARQKRIEAAMPCLVRGAKRLGVTLDYPFTIYF